MLHVHYEIKDTKSVMYVYMFFSLLPSDLSYCNLNSDTFQPKALNKNNFGFLQKLWVTSVAHTRAIFLVHDYNVHVYCTCVLQWNLSKVVTLGPKVNDHCGQVAGCLTQNQPFVQQPHIHDFSYVAVQLLPLYTVYCTVDNTFLSVHVCMYCTYYQYLWGISSRSRIY